MTVYLPPAAKLEIETRAAEMSIAAGTLLRLICFGDQKPLRRVK